MYDPKSRKLSSMNLENATKNGHIVMQRKRASDAMTHLA